jgi:hypothetical protein
MLLDRSLCRGTLMEWSACGHARNKEYQTRKNECYLMIMINGLHIVICNLFY